MPAASFPQLPYPAEGGPFLARPEPTRTAVLAAFQQATRPVPAPVPSAATTSRSRPLPVGPAAASSLAIAAPAPAAPAPAAPAPASLMMPAPLARVETGAQPTLADAPRNAKPAADPPGPDLEALAEYVLERLRHELRDGRERLGFLLDEARG